jgi:NADPH-dependent ferric siderophore reductase
VGPGGEEIVELRRITLRVESAAELAAVGIYFSTGDEGRNYTVRRERDTDLLDIDVMLHAHGPGTAWAATASPGDRVGLDHARSWYHPPSEARWQLLAADLSGLPALARIIEEFRGGRPVTAVVELADQDDR